MAKFDVCMLDLPSSKFWAVSARRIETEFDVARRSYCESGAGRRFETEFDAGRQPDTESGAARQNYSESDVTRQNLIEFDARRNSAKSCFGVRRKYIGGAPNLVTAVRNCNPRYPAINRCTILGRCDRL